MKGSDMRGVVVATVSALTIGCAAPAAADRPAPRAAERLAGVGRSGKTLSSARFNIPSGSAEQQNAIARHIDSLIDATPPGELIRIALYEFTSPTFADALVNAEKRGVRVRLVVDARSRGSAAYRKVVSALGTSRTRPSWIVTCEHGCIGDKIMHNKFFLFSRTGPASDVVVQSSANMTTTNRVNAWNNAFTTSDPALYRGYGDYFAALAARRQHASHYRVSHGDGATLYTFPRAGATAGSDTLYRLLGHVGCSGGTAVRVTTFELTRPAIARRLWSLAHQGCDVRVIYTNLGKRAGRLLRRAGGPQILASHYRYRRNGRSVEAFVHSKYVLIDGTYSGQDRQIVITGSPNDTTPGLRNNDEAMRAIDDPAIHADYADNFAALWRAAGSHVPLMGHVRER
jgi:phosphatidylserine/phosphatidylglycerophosphate/cardiolipin synthase-like enzyme